MANVRERSTLGGRWAAGSPAEILTSKTMSDLYALPVDVLRVRGRVVVLADTMDPTGGHHELPLEPAQPVHQRPVS